MEIIEQTPDRIVLQEISSYRVLWQAITACTLDKPTDLLLLEEQRGNSTRRAQFPLHDVLGANVETSEIQEATDVPSYRCILYLRGPDAVVLGRWTPQGRGLAWLAASIRLFLGVERFPQMPGGVFDPKVRAVQDSLTAIQGQMEALNSALQSLPGTNPLINLVRNTTSGMLQSQTEGPEMSALRARLREHPDDVTGHLQLASLLRLKRQLGPAQDSLERAIRLVQGQGDWDRAARLKEMLYHWIMD